MVRTQISLPKLVSNILQLDTMQESDVSNYKEKKDNLLQRIILLFKAMPEGTETTIEALVDEIDMDVQFSFEDMFELCSDVSSFASKHHISLVEKEPFEKTGLPFRISYKVHAALKRVGDAIQVSQCKKVNGLVRSFAKFDAVLAEDLSADSYTKASVEDIIFKRLNLLTKCDDTKTLIAYRMGFIGETYLAFADAQTNFDGFRIFCAPSEDLIFNNIVVPFTQEGIWQAMLLKDLWALAMPLYDHSNHERIKYVWDEKEAACLRHYESCGTMFEKSEFEYRDYIPKVTLDDTNHTAVVRVAIWNDLDGLTYFSRKIHWKNGKVSFNKPKKEKQLIKYDCGICF